MTFEEAVKLLKQAVKESHLDNQRHIDLTLVDAQERPFYEKALVITRAQVAQNKITEDELKSLLGLL